MRKANLHQQATVSNQKLLVKLFVLAFYSLFTIHCFSQGVGININGNAANSKAMLDVDATGMNPKAGVLVPRMSTGDRNAITSPVPESLLIYNTTTHCFEAYYNGGWVAIGCLSSCGSPFTDSHDGQSYNTVQIGTQCWMAQNLNYGTYTTKGNTPQAAGTKFCQTIPGGAEDATCADGGLYEWANMMNGSSSCNGTGAGQPACSTNVQGLCPNGWHVPSHYEWTKMENAINSTTTFPYDVTTQAWLGTNEGADLKSTTLWQATNCCDAACDGGGTCNSTGFNALPCGYSDGGSLYAASYYAYFWTATEYGSTNAWYRNLDYSTATVYRGDSGKLGGFSVRCVKD